MLKIGEVSKLKNISTKALRHYDRIGLLMPRKTDSKTRYRLYNDEDIKELSKIMILKEAGFSLKYIKNLINNGLSVQD